MKEDRIGKLVGPKLAEPIDNNQQRLSRAKKGLDLFPHALGGNRSL
jgi:hypothetical protein